MMQATSLMQENENSSKAIGSKPNAAAAMAKPGAAAVPSRRFGTALSVNTNVPVPSIVSAKGVPAAAAQPPKPTVMSSAASSAPPDHVTAADIAGAMDIDIADRYVLSLFLKWS